jgi:hypothetical protein
MIGLGKVADNHAGALASLPRSRFLAVCDAVAERGGGSAANTTSRHT